MDPKRDKHLYPIRSAARLTRLSIDTLRAWEKRYGVVQPARDKGVRLYSDADVERLSLLREALEQGHSIGQVAGLPNKDLIALSRRKAAGRRISLDERPTETILQAVDSYDYATANRELARLASLMSPRDLIHTIALPLMRIVGDRWHEQTIRIAQEHIVSQLLTNLLGAMIRIYASFQPPARIMTATLSDDLHEFGILAAAMLSTGAGLGVTHLGANLPAKEIAYAAKRSRADVVLISITNLQDRMLREEQLRTLRASVATNVEIWVGVNPPNTDLSIKGVRILRNFADLELEIRRVGGKI